MYNKKFILFIGLYLVGAVLISYLVLNELSLSIKENLIRQDQKQLLVSARYVDSILMHYSFSLSYIADQFANFSEHCTRRQLQAALRDFPEMYIVNVINSQGKIVQSTYPKAKGLDISDRNYFKKVMTTGKPYVSNLYRGRASGKYIFSLSVPIKKENEIVGVLSAGMSLSFFQKIISGNIDTKDKDIVISLVDGNSTVLYSSQNNCILKSLHYHPVIKSVLAGRNGTEEQMAPILKDIRLFTYMPIKRAHWGMIISQPVNQAYQLLFYVLGRCILIIFLFFIPLALLLFYLFRIEKLRYLELSQIQEEKARTVNELAASVAHEIRNPLTSIRGFVQLLTKKVTGEQGENYIKVIIEEIDRLESIIGDFLSFARFKEEKKEQCNLKKIMEFTHNLAQSRAAYNKVRVSLDAPLPLYIYGNQAELKQAFLNFCINAIQAMPQGGALHLSLVQDKDKAVISFQDNGCGMEQSTINHLGQRYFTTKKEGTGLGLAVSYRIIKKHQGKIEVTSQPGVGTTFKVIFPL